MASGPDSDLVVKTCQQKCSKKISIFYRIQDLRKLTVGVVSQSVKEIQILCLHSGFICNKIAPPCVRKCNYWVKRLLNTQSREKSETLVFHCRTELNCNNMKYFNAQVFMIDCLDNTLLLFIGACIILDQWKMNNISKLLFLQVVLVRRCGILQCFTPPCKFLKIKTSFQKTILMIDTNACWSYRF